MLLRCTPLLPLGYLRVDWKVLEATQRHLPGREVGTATIALISLKLKASYDIEMETSTNAYCKGIECMTGSYIVECQPV